MGEFHRRRLPHYYPVNAPIFVTWSLHGAFPPGRRFPCATTEGKAFVAMDRVLDNARTGPMYLKQSAIASKVVEAIEYRAERMGHYDLHTYVIMANHVHLLMTPHMEVSKIMHSLKLFTAREANRILGLTGPFWQDESYDRIVRNGEEFNRIVRYIEMNPVSAGIVSSPDEFPYSRAGRIGNPPQVGNLPHINF
jgi:REP element-mobilizing transposase RayT